MFNVHDTVLGYPRTQDAERTLVFAKSFKIQVYTDRTETVVLERHTADLSATTLPFYFIYFVRFCNLWKNVNAHVLLS